MTNRRIAFLLVVIMCLNLVLPTFSFADSSTIQNQKPYAGDIFDEDILLNSSVTINEIRSYLSSKYLPETDDGKYFLNPYVFQKYKVVAYTDQEAIDNKIAGLSSKGTPKKETQIKDGTGKRISIDEYRYLGYKLNGSTIITNDFFPSDSKTISNPTKRKYIFTDPEKKSYGDSILINEGMLYHLFKTDVYNDDDNEGVFKKTGYTIAEMVKENDTNRTAKFPTLMSEPTFATPGVLMLAHIVRGTKWYDTVQVEQFKYSPETIIDVDKVDVKLPVGTTTYDINYSVTTKINDLKTDSASLDGRYFNNIKIDGDYEKNLYTNEKGDNENLPSLKESNINKTVDLKGFKPGVRNKVNINATSIITTFDNNVQTSKDIATVYITLVAKDTVDFTIKRNETDVTDGTVTVENIANPNLTLTLEDTSFVESGDITSYVYKVVTPTGEKTVSGGLNPVASYTITGGNKACIIDGKVTFIEYVHTAKGLVGSVKHIVNVKEKTTPSGPSGGLVAILTSTAAFNKREDYYEVMEGERFTLKGNKSYHEAGLDLTNYDFDVYEELGEGMIYRRSKKSVGAYYPESDGGAVYKARLAVTAKDGGVDTDTIRTKVHPARFDPEIEIYGTFKENRRLSFFVYNTHKLTYYPIDESSLRWTITPLDGQGDVIRIDGTTDGQLTFDALFKKSGRYKVSVEGEIWSKENIKRYSGSVEKVFTIAEDLPPIADFEIRKRQPRDISNGLMTKLIVYDNSKSIDDDLIVQRIASIKRDTNNDGNFDEEMSKVFYAGNETEFYVLEDHVGDYQFELKVKEEFGQETISRFITDADKKRGDTSNKSPAEKTTELYNVAPTVELEVSQKKKVNLIVYEDTDLSESLKLNTVLDEIKTGLVEKKIDLATYKIKPTKIVADRTHYPVYRDTFIELDVLRTGEDENSDRYSYIETVRLLLDSQKTTETGRYTSQKGRFTIIRSELDSSYHGGPKFKEKGRFRCYFDRYRNLNITYRDNWSGQTYTKTYKFVTDYDYRSYNSGVDNELRSEGEWLRSTTLVEDKAITYYESYYYNDFDAPLNPQSKEHTRYLSVSRNLSSQRIQIKHFSQTALNNIFASIPKGEDIFFLNVCDNIYNQLTFDKEFVETLKAKNITYMSTNKDKLRINPLTGQYDKIVLGNNVLVDKKEYYPFEEKYEKECIVKIGDIAYRLDYLTGEYIALGDFDSQYSHARLPGASGVESIIYNYSKALAEYTSGVDDFEDEYDDGDWAYKGDFLTDYLGPNYYHTVSGDLDITTDGHLTSKRYYSHDYGILYYNYPSFGSGYLGELKDVTYKYQTSKGGHLIAKGFVHSNGNIYFKEGNGAFRYAFKNGLVITEGINNIRKMVQLKDKNEIYVYTDNLVVKYNTETKVKTVVTNFIRRIGTSVEIEPNKWMSFDKVFEGYKFIAYKEGVVNKDPDYTTSTGWTKLYIDMDDNYWIERDYDAEYKYKNKWYTVDKSSKTLLGKDVKTLPFMDLLDELPLSYSYNGNFTKPYMYTGNDGYLYTVPNIKKAFSFTDDFELETPNPKGRYEGYGMLKKIDIVDGYVTLELYTNGVLGFNEHEYHGFLRTFSFATLNEGNPGAIVSESELVGVSALSQAFASKNALAKGILEIYKDYTTSDTMTLLLNETVNTSMVMFDYEDDPAYKDSMVIDTEHVDPDYFENGLGKDPNVGKGIILNQFKYVGHYIMEARVRDNPVGEDDRFDAYRLWNKDNTKVNVYVHRKPIAKMKTRFMETPTGMTLKLSDGGSYDLDHASKANNGIVAWRWSVKTPDDIAWSTYDSQTLTIDAIDKTLTYHVALQVKDLEGVWSDPVMTLLEPLDQPILLSAKVKSHKDKFSLHRVPITEDYELYAVETQYHQPLTLEIGLYDEDKLVSTIKSLDMIEGTTGHYKDEDKVCFVWHNQLVNVPETLADGPYTIGLKAKAVGQASKQATCSLAVGVETPINPEPSLDPLWITGESYEITCKTSPYTNGVDLTLYSGTAMEQRIGMTFEKTITETSQGQEAETKKIWRLSYTVPEDIPDGQYKMTFTGRVNTQPEKTATVQEAVHIQTLGIDQVKLTGAWQHWRGQIDMFGEQLLDMPYRFLSWEEIYFVVTTVGHPDSVYVTMSDALEAMSFTDRNGVRYDYIDDMGYEVTFPLQFEKIGKNLWRGTYILPLAASTLSWSNERLHPPYEMVVTAEKNGIKSHYYFNESLGRGIDITGNTTDLIYVQPRPKR